MPVRENFFESLFGFAEADYATTRQALFQRCTLEAVRAGATGRVVKERALFQHPRLAAGSSVSSGWHSTPSVAELRTDAAAAVQRFEQTHPGVLAQVAAAAAASSSSPARSCAASPISCVHVVGEAGEMHRRWANALFQAASQFNLLEFVSSDVTPEDGVRHYVHDRTQGPACALACMGGTAYRNYLLHTDLFAGAAHRSSNPSAAEEAAAAARGQQSAHQVNTLDDAVEYLTRAHGRDGVVPALPRDHFFTISNGYFFMKDAMTDFTSRIASIAGSEDGSSAEAVAEALVSRLRIGLVEDATVTLPLQELTNRNIVALPGAAGAVDVHEVTQTYNSALSLPSRTACASRKWDGVAALSRLILRGTYEATLLAAVQHTLRQLERQVSSNGGAAAALTLPPIFLTKVGGGVFNNDDAWIAEGVREAVRRVETLGVPLDVRLVHFREVDRVYLGLFPTWPVLQ